MGSNQVRFLVNFFFLKIRVGTTTVETMIQIGIKF